MTKREKLERALAGGILDRILKYIDKDPSKNIVKIINYSEKFLGGIFPQKYLNGMKKAVSDKNNVYYRYALNFLKDVDHQVLKKMLLAAGLGAGVHGTKEVRKNRDVYNCNIPWLILMDPTSACNLHCKGCWSAEYGHKLSLTYDEMADVVRQCKELGTHVFMFTGGEPLIRKNDILRLCENNPDCVFLAYTNATLIDEQFCDDVKRVGNFALALSVEGNEEVNDSRRGTGAYKVTMEKMKLLKEKGCLFGISVCYTSNNVEYVTSEKFLDTMVESGVKYAFYFNYMPVGSSAVPSLIPTPEQRKFMYSWLKKVRNGQTGKPLFVMDFQDDGEYVGGCIAGGRNYFHINSAGDMEPCVFIHYSDSNIRKNTILEGLRNPLFMAYRKGQPFNENHLRPCPMLENPELLKKMINETGAASTDLIEPESVEQLCAKCEHFAEHWAPVAKQLWEENEHPNPKTQYYRDSKQK